MTPLPRADGYGVFHPDRGRLAVARAVTDRSTFARLAEPERWMELDDRR